MYKCLNNTTEYYQIYYWWEEEGVLLSASIKKAIEWVALTGNQERDWIFNLWNKFIVGQQIVF